MPKEKTIRVGFVRNGDIHHDFGLFDKGVAEKEFEIPIFLWKAFIDTRFSYEVLYQLIFDEIDAQKKTPKKRKKV